MNEEMLNLKPAKVFYYFNEITKIPRPSKREEKMSLWLEETGKKLGLPTKRDKVGNVLISKPATPGKENVTPVVLQAHMDMVCEKNNDKVFDFDKDAIETYIDGEWLKAKGTTLGADDGIGVALALAVLDDNELEHGPIEALFTIDEETGLTGAAAVEAGFISLVVPADRTLWPRFPLIMSLLRATANSSRSRLKAYRAVIAVTTSTRVAATP